MQRNDRLSAASDGQSRSGMRKPCTRTGVPGKNMPESLKWRAGGQFHKFNRTYHVFTVPPQAIIARSACHSPVNHNEHNSLGLLGRAQPVIPPNLYSAEFCLSTLKPGVLR